MKPLNLRAVTSLMGAMLVLAEAEAVTFTLINNDTPGYYNSAIGLQLNDTSTAFPVSTDPILDFTIAPNLAPAQSVLGQWLSQSPQFDIRYWSVNPIAIPRQWQLGAETAIVYPVRVPSGGYTNVVLSIGVDNGVFVWFNGQFLGGHIRPGGAIPGEHKFNIPSMNPGLNYIQILREDHGFSNDWTIEGTANTVDAPIHVDSYTAIEVAWQSELNALYQIQTTTNLIQTAWTNFGETLVGTGSEMVIFKSTRNPPRTFYRVLKVE